MEHTPGPWRVENREHALGELAIMSSNGWVACAATMNEGLVNAEANARLIAAAPEMLEALWLITCAYGASDGRNGNSGECWDKARQALKKARGEQ